MFKPQLNTTQNNRTEQILIAVQKEQWGYKSRGINLTFQTSFRKFLTDILNINCDTKPVAMGKYFSDHSDIFIFQMGLPLILITLLIPFANDKCI